MMRIKNYKKVKKPLIFKNLRVLEIKFSTSRERLNCFSNEEKL